MYHLSNEQTHNKDFSIAVVLKLARIQNTPAWFHI